MTPNVVLAVDVGGTKTSVALVDRSGTVLETSVGPTPAGVGPDAILTQVAKLSADVLRESTPVRVVGIGVGTAGVVDVDHGTIVSATDTLADWAGTQVARRLGELLAPLVGHIPVHVQNDVHAHAVGELRHGAAAGRDSALVVAVGTGIGSAFVLDGAVRRGHRHVAGEIAHAPISGADHLRCTCGRRGHLEALGSGLGMLAQYRALGGDTTVADARGVVARANAEPVARQALDDAAAAVGRGIAAAVTVLDPAAVVVSGGVTTAGATWWQPMEKALRSELVDVLADLPVFASTLGVRAPLLGASVSAWALVEVDA